MKKNFWQKLKRPIFALAPMAGITDSAFRQICKEFGVDLLYSEMVSSAALFYNSVKTLELLQFDKKEAPFVVQLFGNNPKYFADAVKLLTNKKGLHQFQSSNFQIPSGIDINFGCPSPKILKQEAGAALMQNLKTASEVIKAVINNTELPVSIKLRAKSGEVDCLRFLDYMRDLPISAAMIHGRTLAQGFSGPINWEIIKKARNYFGGVILANGGVMSLEDIGLLLNKTSADGIGIARGALGNPWIFKFAKRRQRTPINAKYIFKTALKHAKLVEKLKGEQGIAEMRKHLCWYVHGLPNACAMRKELVRVESMEDIKAIFSFQKSTACPNCP